MSEMIVMAESYAFRTRRGRKLSLYYESVSDRKIHLIQTLLISVTKMDALRASGHFVTQYMEI
jgi:hypothetical protein